MPLWPYLYYENSFPQIVDVAIRGIKEEYLLVWLNISSHPFVRTLAPEIALLYKSNDLSVTSNRLDFHAALPHLSERQRHWLMYALSMLWREHEWLAALADS